MKACMEEEIWKTIHTALFRIMEHFSRSPTISVWADACTHKSECRQSWGGGNVSFKLRKNRVLSIFWSTGMMNSQSYWKIFCEDFQPFSDMVNCKKFHCIKVTLSFLCGIKTPCNLFQNLLLTFSRHLHKRRLTVPKGISHVAFWHKK